MANCQEICSTDSSKSRNNDSGKGKSVTVLLPSDVTVGKKTREVLMPNTIEMAQIKKTGKERFKTGIHFSSKMSEKDVEKTLQDEFNILKNHRFCCASAADNRTKLNFHGEQRVWDGRFIKRNITGNSALYILIQLEETNTSGLTRKSGESHQQPIPGPSNQKMIPPGAASVVSRPFNKDLVPNPTSHLKWASEKRNIDSEIAQQESSSQQSHPGLAKRKKRIRLNVVLEQKSQKKSSSTTVTPHSGSTDLQQTENQVLMYQTLGDNATKSGIFSWQNLLPAVSKGLLGTTPLLGTTGGNSSQQVQHCDKAVAGNIHVGMQVFSQASQQSSNPMEVTVMTPIALQSDLSMSTSTMVQGSPPQHWPIAREHSVEHVATDPREPVPLEKEQQDRTVPNVHCETLKSLSHCSKHDQRSVAQASLKPVSTTSISQQRELTAQTSEHGSPLQQPPPASAAADKKVHTASTKKPSVSERQREILPHERQEFRVLFSASDGETSDSAFGSILDNESNHDTVQSRDTCIVHKITPCKGSTKGGDDFDIILRDILPLEIDSCVACFQNCGTVNLDQTVNPFTLSGRTPKSLQGPGPVNVTLMSSDGSWQGGEAVFEYIDDPLTVEEFLSKVLTDRDMRRELFNRMDKEMSSIKPSDGQTTDSCGKTAPGSSSLSHSKCAWSVELLRLLVYKAAEIGGGEFIQMIFSTSARKVVFNSYKNSATLPEDVARSNGHLTLANYLQDVNSRLSKESNSDAGTESIDWLELKHAVDEEQSLTSGTNEAQILRKCQPPGYPENDDDDDDDERDYFADDETSPSSSPCHSKVFDSENEAQNQNSKVAKSSCEQEANEEDNLPVENSDSSELPLHREGNQLEVMLSVKAENAGYKHNQLDSYDLESHSSGDDITEKEHERTVPCHGEVKNWDTLGSEVISEIEEASTGTTSSHTATHKCHNVVVTYGSESGLDGDQTELKMIDNDENSRSREPLNLEKCRQQLQSIYNTMSKVKIIPWDESCAIHIDEIYTTLSWVRDDRKVSGVIQKELKDYTDIFRGDKHHPNPKRLLVYGRPGIGKTTFSKKTAFDWSQQRKETLKKFDVVLLIKLRDVCDLKDIRDVLRASKLLAGSEMVSVDDVYEYILRNQEKALLILDGYDEYFCTGEQSPVRDIWIGRQLSGIHVIITTRQEKTDELRLPSDVQFEINGFTSDNQVRAFASKVLGDEGKVEEFVAYLDQRHLKDLAEIPLLLLMLCTDWNETHFEELPKSRAHICQNVVLTLIHHAIAKDVKADEEEDINCLELYNADLCALGKLAFDALLQNALSFSFGKLPHSIYILSDKFIKFGLIYVLNAAKFLRREKHVYFIHKSVQEYLAAFYLKELLNGGSTSCLSEVDSFETIVKMIEVLRFACELSADVACTVLSHLGIVGEKEGLTKYHFTETPCIEDLSDDQKQFLTLISHSFFSCTAKKRRELYPMFLSSVSGVLFIDSDQLHSLANEHFLKSAAAPELTFFPSSLGREESYQVLISVLEDLSAVVVCCWGREWKASDFLKMYSLSLSEVEVFLKREEGKIYLYIAEIKRFILSTCPTEIFAELISPPESTQKTVDDQSNEQDDSSAFCLTDNSTDDTRATHHCLSFVWKIDVSVHERQEIKTLIDVLPFVTSLRDIRIFGRGSATDPVLVDALVSRINFTNRLHTLALGNINLTAKPAAVIARSLYQAPDLRFLDLSHNPLGEGVSDLMRHLCCAPVLETLHLECVVMTKKQVSDLTEAVRRTKISKLFTSYHERNVSESEDEQGPVD